MTLKRIVELTIMGQGGKGNEENQVQSKKNIKKWQQKSKTSSKNIKQKDAKQYYLLMMFLKVSVFLQALRLC